MLSHPYFISSDGLAARRANISAGKRVVTCDRAYDSLLFIAGKDS
jgi:hypothetical protein